MHRGEIAEMPRQKQSKTPVVALLGNPNCGKSSVFNQLTGLRQKVGNFPGVTVDRKSGKTTLQDGLEVELVDLPGTYSLHPSAKDERIVVNTLANHQNENYPDALIYIANSAQLEKHLLLFTQLLDLGIPMVLGLNMSDVADLQGVRIDAQRLSRYFKLPVILINGRTGEGIDNLKEAMTRTLQCELGDVTTRSSFYRFSEMENRAVAEVQRQIPTVNRYQALLIAHHYQWLPFLSPNQREALEVSVQHIGFEDLRWQVEETMSRYDRLTPIVEKSILREKMEGSTVSERVDKVVTHAFWGPIIFFGLMVLVFQAIFAGATYPMDWIEAGFGILGEWLQETGPESWWMDLLVNGVVAGLGGILVFIPQIAILFLLISILEELGYMARAVYLFDNLMGRFGLNGRSIVALISGGACAVPAIMSTRTISNWKERMITILVTPLISCSARIPVYTLLIGFAVPEVIVGGVFNLQGLAFMGLYVLGILAALGAALVFKWILKSNDRSFLTLELPDYRRPHAKNVLLTVYEKVKTFTLEAGKVILAISIVLWALASYGPSKAMEEARTTAAQQVQELQLDENAAADLMASREMEASYAGHLGRAIEPAIQPLGFDWKIGIALITSFAAREVFVGTMATIYSIGSAPDEFSIRDKLATEVNPATGELVYNRATSWSLLIFYVFAMQCMSTLAVVKRETKTWKWPIIQFLFMSGMAYLGSLLVYQWLS
jgi:ferrous iron transport protein B